VLKQEVALNQPHPAAAAVVDSAGQMLDQTQLLLQLWRRQQHQL
jgi:hypothetical protein